MNTGSMQWKFFLGSCILAVGLLLKAGAPLVPVAVGVVAAALATWYLRGARRLPR